MRYRSTPKPLCRKTDLIYVINVIRAPGNARECMPGNGKPRDRSRALRRTKAQAASLTLFRQNLKPAWFPGRRFLQWQPKKGFQAGSAVQFGTSPAGDKAV